MNNLPFKIKKLKSGKFLVYATTEEAKEFGEDKEHENDRSAYWGLMWRYKAMVEANLETEDERLYKDAPWWVKSGVNKGHYTQVQNHKNDSSLDANMCLLDGDIWIAFDNETILATFQETILATFQIGSTCKKGDIHFVPSNEQEFIEQEIEFWKGKGFDVQECKVGDLGFEFKMRIANGRFGKGITHYAKLPQSYGRGEWTAQTLEDAKQMCIDYLTNLEG